MKSIQILGVTDPEGGNVNIEVISIYQDEPVNGQGDGDTSPDGIKTPLQVRSERSGEGDGRVYHISFTATDAEGGQCSGVVTVCVPHDSGGGSVCIDGGLLYDSTII